MSWNIGILECWNGILENPKRIIFHSSVIPLFFLFLSSCEKDFIVPEQGAAKRMVINCMFTDAWQMSVYITPSYASGGTNYIIAIDDAHVELYEDGEFKEVLNYVPSDTLETFGSYRSVLIPQKGKKYFIKASHPLYGVATAEDEMPMPAQIISQQLLQYPDTFNPPNDALVNFKFADDGTKENFYRINTWADFTWYSFNQQGDSTERRETYSLQTEFLSPVQDTVRENFWFTLFSDRGFNGGQQEMRIKIPYAPIASRYTSVHLRVELFTVSKAHYEYYRTLEIASNNNGNSEPVHVYSNVKNGYGIFAAEDFQWMEFVVK